MLVTLIIKLTSSIGHLFINTVVIINTLIFNTLTIYFYVNVHTCDILLIG